MSRSRRPRDEFEAAVTPEVATKSTGEVAPEVSQGAWRERVFTPRAVLSREGVRQGLESTARIVLAAQNQTPQHIYPILLRAWLPFLRQALEQAGGDGIDHWLQGLFGKVGRPNPAQAHFAALADALVSIREANAMPEMEAAAKQTVELVDRALASSPVKLSFRQMERQLEGKVEVDGLLRIRCESLAHLEQQQIEIEATLNLLRDQISSRPGQRPEGMYANFVRLKTELKVLRREIGRRRQLG